MKIDVDMMTRYLHRMRNQPGWASLNDVATSVNMDRATSRRYTKTAEEWELIERQQLENQPTQIQATKKLMELEPGEVRKFVQANYQEFDV